MTQFHKLFDKKTHKITLLHALLGMAPLSSTQFLQIIKKVKFLLLLAININLI